MRTPIITSLVLLFLLNFPACFQADTVAKKLRENITDEKTCRERGGHWGRFGLLVEERCNLPAPDAGKVCEDMSQCEGACIAELTQDESHRLEEGPLVSMKGKCSPRQLNFGCHPFVHQGRVDGILCVD